MPKSKNGILTGNTTANTVAWTGQRRVANGSRKNSPSYLVPLRTNTAPVFRMTDFRESARVCSAYGRSLCPCLCSGFPVKVCEDAALHTGSKRNVIHACQGISLITTYYIPVCQRFLAPCSCQIILLYHILRQN